MNPSELKALVSLLDEDDEDNLLLVEQKIQSLGEEVIPFLEQEWENNLNPIVQNKIEDLIHNAQFKALKILFEKWTLKKKPDLLEGMYLCAKYNFPNLKMADIKLQIKQLSLQAAEHHNDGLHAFEQIRVFNKFLFTTNKFKPNRKAFHNPSNSFLNIVLESKYGNPLSLSVVYQLIAQHLGMPIYGVNFPNLFIVTYKGLDKQFYINPYNNGLIFTKTDIDDYLKQLKLPPEEKFYQPCSSHEIIARNLRNLITSYQKENNITREKEINSLLNIVERSIF